MMIKVEAIVREEVFEDVKEALNAIDVNGITVSQVMGCGAQRGYIFLSPVPVKYAYHPYLLCPALVKTTTPH